MEEQPLSDEVHSVYLPVHLEAAIDIDVFCIVTISDNGDDRCACF